MATEREQKLVDLCFEMVQLTATGTATFNSQDASCAWVRRQLKLCGFPTRAVGMSHGVLCSEKDYVDHRGPGEELLTFNITAGDEPT